MGLVRKRIQYWYCLQIHPHQDELAEWGINQLGIELFRPTMLGMQRKAEVLKPVFPGYIFVRFSIVHEPHWRHLWYVPGAKRLLSCDAETPIQIDPRVIKALQAIHQTKVDEVPAPSSLQEHDEVEVLAGPFKMFKGIVQKSPSERVAILLTMLGRQHIIEVNQSDVRQTTQAD